MSGLSRCGRPYPNFARAVLAAELRADKSRRAYVATSCALGDHWHVVLNANANGKAYRPDPFPPAVRSQLVIRDECCQRCGNTGRLEAHHRRAKSMGGSKARSHTQCSCNGVLVCRRCHAWIHEHPASARADGLIVRQSVALPSSVPMQPWKAWRSVIWYPTCEGNWHDGQEQGVRI